MQNKVQTVKLEFEIYVHAGFKTPFCHRGTFHMPLQTSPWDPSYGKLISLSTFFSSLFFFNLLSYKIYVLTFLLLVHDMWFAQQPIKEDYEISGVFSLTFSMIVSIGMRNDNIFWVAFSYFLMDKTCELITVIFDLSNWKRFIGFPNDQLIQWERDMDKIGTIRISRRLR